MGPSKQVSCRELFAETTYRIQAGRGIATQPPMPHAGQFFAAYRFSCQDARQEKIQDRDFVVHAAGGDAQYRDMADCADKEHGSRQDRRAIDGFRGPGRKDTCPGPVIGPFQLEVS